MREKNKRYTLKPRRLGKGYRVTRNRTGCIIREKVSKRLVDQSPSKKLDAFRQVVGIWEGKDTSFFDKK
jgi:hypothetical protein